MKIYIMLIFYKIEDWCGKGPMWEIYSILKEGSSIGLLSCQFTIKNAMERAKYPTPGTQP